MHLPMPPTNHPLGPPTTSYPTIVPPRTSLQDVSADEEKLRARTAELEDAKKTVEAATELLQDSEARGRELYEENKRLSEHIAVGGGGGWVGDTIVGRERHGREACRSRKTEVQQHVHAAHISLTYANISFFTQRITFPHPRRTWSPASAPPCTKRSKRRS